MFVKSNPMFLIMLQMVMAVKSVIKTNSATIKPREKLKVSKQPNQRIWLNEMVYCGAAITHGVKVCTKSLSQ